MSELARDLTNTVFFFTRVCVCLGGNTTACYQSIPNTPCKGLQWLLAHSFPRPGRLFWKAAQQQVTGSCPPAVAGSWQCSGKGLQQGVCTVQGTKAWRGLRQSCLSIPLQGHTDSLCSCTQRAPFTRRGRVGGTGMGATHSAPLSCLSKRATGAAWLCQCNVTIEMSASCESAFCFPKRKQAGILISPCLFPSHALICIRVD